MSKAKFPILFFNFLLIIICTTLDLQMKNVNPISTSTLKNLSNSVKEGVIWISFLFAHYLQTFRPTLPSFHVLAFLLGPYFCLETWNFLHLEMDILLSYLGICRTPTLRLRHFLYLKRKVTTFYYDYRILIEVPQLIPM